MIATLQIIALICIVILTATATSIIKDIDADPKRKRIIKNKTHDIVCKTIGGAVPTIATIVSVLFFVWAILF